MQLNESNYALGLLNDALTCARKSGNELVLCFVIFLRWNLLDESNEKEIELGKFQSLLKQQATKAKDSELLQFLKEQNDGIIKMQSKIQLPLVKHNSTKSFQFLQALILYFFHSATATELDANVVELVKIIVSGCSRLPGCSKERLSLFLQNYAGTLKRSEHSEAMDTIEQLLSELAST